MRKYQYAVLDDYSLQSQMITFKLKSHFHVKVLKRNLTNIYGILKVEINSENNDFAGTMQNALQKL